jgi:hypothetical protein
MRVLADVNVPTEYVAALRGDGHAVSMTRSLGALGPEAIDTEICQFAQDDGWAILSTEVKDFSDRAVDVPVFVAPQDMSGGEVQAAVARLRALPVDPAETEPIWLSAL